MPPKACVRRFAMLNYWEIQIGNRARGESAIAPHRPPSGRSPEQAGWATTSRVLQLLGGVRSEFESSVKSVRQTLRPDKLGGQVECNLRYESRLTMMLCRLNYPLVAELPILERQISTGRFELDNLRNNFPDSDSKSMAPCLKARLSQNRDARPFV